MSTIKPKHVECYTKQGSFRIVEDSRLKFFPKGGSPLEFSVRETHALLNMLFDYRREIISTNQERLRKEELQKETNKAHSTLVADIRARYGE